MLFKNNMSWLNCLSRKNPEFDDVKVLDFSRSALTEVPSVVFNFERTLDSLHLDGNKICDLPRTLFQCEELRYLNLSDNEIHNIPPLIVKLGSLQYLNLSRNYLKHTSIPANIHKCQKLTVLDLSSNNLEKLPECITSLVSLQELYLNDIFIDFFPATVGRLNNLHILELRDNMLSMLPKSLKRLVGLQRLDLSNNDFCELPEVTQYLHNLTELWINGNCIKIVPSEIGNLRKLTHFDGSNNEIESLPREIGLWSNITYLALSENMLKEIPVEICKLRQLETLKLDHNYIEQLPENFGNLKNLEDLDLRFNNLKSLPSSIGMLRKLNCLIASNNYITSLPPEIGSCSGLRILNLDVNLLNFLPQEIGHIQNLVSVSLINNKLKYLPITVLKLSKLRALWLSQNQNQPLITLQKERKENGQIVLTCIFLPQAVASSVQHTQLAYPSPSRRKICFTEPGVQKDFAPHLTRAPTPYPKDYQRYRKSVANILRRQNKDLDHTSMQDLNMPIVKEALVTIAKMNEGENDSNLTTPAENHTEQLYVKKSLSEKYIKNTRDANDSTTEDTLQNTVPSDSVINHTDLSNDNHLGVNVGESVITHENSSYKSENDLHFCKCNTSSEDSNNKHLSNYNYCGSGVNDKKAQFDNKISFDGRDQSANIKNENADNNRQPDQNQNNMRLYNNNELNNSKLINSEQNEHFLVQSVSKNDMKLYHTAGVPCHNSNSVNRPLQFYSTESDSSISTESCNTFAAPKSDGRFVDSLIQKTPVEHSLRREIKPPPYHIAAAYSKNAHFFNDPLKSSSTVSKSQAIEEKPKHFTQDQPTNIIMPQPQHPFRLPQEESTHLDTAQSVKFNKQDALKDCQDENTTENLQQYEINSNLEKVNNESVNEQTNKDNLLRDNLRDASCEQDNEKQFIENQGSKDSNYIEKSYLQGWIFGKHRNRRILECPVTPTRHLGFDYVTTSEGLFVTNVIDVYNKGSIMIGDKILMVDDFDLAMYPLNDSVKYLIEAGPTAEKFLVSRE